MGNSARALLNNPQMLGGPMQDDHDLFTYRTAKIGFGGIAAFALGFIAHYDLGFSRLEIRIGCLVIAVLAAVWLIIETVRRK
jgi:hypothetical protein